MTTTYGTHIHNMLQPFLGAPAWAVELGLMMALIIEQGTEYMTALDDELAAIKAEQAKTTALVATVKADVDSLIAKIAGMSQAGLSTDQQSQLDGILQAAKDLNTSLTAVDAEVNVPPAAAPAAAAPVASS